jgi:ABC-type Fe3+/spermidine/putrescine transport system ATPase subunit
MGAALKIEKVSVAYGSFLAVKDASCDLGSGKTLVMLGPSGCGKTSLLNAIAGFLPIQRGGIRMGDKEVSHLPVRQRGIGMVFQSHALFPHLTVAENIAFGLQIRGESAAQIGKRVQEACTLVQLQGFGGRYPRFLSGGQQQRVALARSLVLNPDVLLLDEPLSSLDAKLRHQMRLELRELQEATGVTMVYVTHDQDEAFALGDLVAVMNQGRIVQLDRPREIYENPSEAFVASFVGNANLVPARVARDLPDGICAVELSTGESVRCRNPHRMPVSSQAMLVVRPGILSIKPDDGSGAARNALRAQLRLARFMGNAIEVICQHPLAEINVSLGIAESDRQPSFVPGASVLLDWEPSHALVVPAEAPR